ncbi:MAG: type I-D CRISPR-associated protein Cas5/Csc1 [Halobacteria archaeon]
MNVLEVRLTTQGRVGFASREVGRLVDTSEYILNTALYYAFGFASGRYVDTKFRPTYIEDTADVAEQLYITPAAPIEQPDYSTAFYNARDDEYAIVNYSAQDDPTGQQDLNLPKFGSERRFTNGNEFRLYVIPKSSKAQDVAKMMPGYARLGKKRGKVRVDTRIVEAYKSSGEFVANHPFGVNDYDNTPLSNVISKKMRPTPIILQAKYEDSYLAIPRENQPSAKLPTDLTFLGKKR